MRGFESHVFRHKMQETLFGVFSIAKVYGRKAILFKYEYLWKYLKTISAKKISILLFILFNSVVK
mgnify:CR=1 FL=1